MSTNNTANPDASPQVLQAYTLLQIAAETSLGTTKPGYTASNRATDAHSPVLSVEAPTKGNLQSSRMTTQQAAQFKEEWDVVSYLPSTATGFSATLFKLKPDHADPSKGTYEGQYVISLRSTEFIENQVRDSKATNELEIKEGGWAFGQIADMQIWWNSLQGTLKGAHVDATGWSRRCMTANRLTMAA